MSKEELERLDKSELVDLVYDYWSQLKTQADHAIRVDGDRYMMEEFGKVKMTEANRLRNMLHHKLNQNKDEKKIHIKEVEKYCNEKGYYIGEYWFKSKQR